MKNVLIVGLIVLAAVFIYLKGAPDITISVNQNQSVPVDVRHTEVNNQISNGVRQAAEAVQSELPPPITFDIPAGNGGAVTGEQWEQALFGDDAAQYIDERAASTQRALDALAGDVVNALPPPIVYDMP